MTDKLKDNERCPEFREEGSGWTKREPRKLRCQGEVGHEGQCHYHRQGGQGGSLTRWWGANPRPFDWIGDYTHHDLEREVWRLRALCDAREVDWHRGLTPEGKVPPPRFTTADR